MALGLAACGGGASSTPGQVAMTGETVVTIDGKPVSQDYLDAITANMPKKQLEMMKSSGQYKDFVEQMALGQLLYEKALAEGMQNDAKTQIRLAVAARDALAKEYIARKAAEAVTEDAVKKAYDDRKVQYAKPQVKVRHLLVADEAAAQAALARIQGGEDFAKVVGEVSTDRGTTTKGGDLGWMSEGQLDKALTDAAFAAAKDAVIGPIQTRFGWHVAQVVDKRDATPIEDVREQLEQGIKQETMKKIFEELKANAKIEWTNPPPEPDPAARPAGPGGLGGMMPRPSMNGGPIKLEAKGGPGAPGAPAGAPTAPPAAAPTAPPAAAPTAPPAAAPTAPPAPAK
jgi:peptidyl-prolyl cis-trans isomerase C